MFENPIQGSVGGTCKRLAGLVYGIGVILIIAILICSIIPMFSQEGTQACLASNKEDIPGWLKARMSNECSDWAQKWVQSWFDNNNGLVSSYIGPALVWARVWIFTSAIWNAIKCYLMLFATVLGLNIIGDAINSLAVIAHRMPKDTSKE